MFKEGKINADVLNKHLEFSYYEPIIEPLTLISVDPLRLNPINEYPRFTDTPNSPFFKRNHIIEYRVTINNDNVASVWLKGNEYTLVRACKKIKEFRVNPRLISYKVLDEILMFSL